MTQLEKEFKKLSRKGYDKKFSVTINNKINYFEDLSPFDVAREILTRTEYYNGFAVDKSSLNLTFSTGIIGSSTKIKNTLSRYIVVSPNT